MFKLVKVNGQWRITNPPQFRMLTEPDFSQVYKPQDLYFFDSTGQVLVPDAVFVPTGTSPTTLVTNLVGALLEEPADAMAARHGQRHAPRHHRVSQRDHDQTWPSTGPPRR